MGLSKEVNTDCQSHTKTGTVELNKWYYKEYKGDCIRKTLIYLNKYSPIYDYYKGYSVKQTTFADGTTEMYIDDNCTFNYYDIVHIKPCNNPMDVFKEATDKYFNDWFGI